MRRMRAIPWMMHSPRRRWIGQLAALASMLAQPGASWSASTGGGFASVLPGRTLQFPRDHGAHPDYRIEWWYVTAWLRETGASDRPWTDDGLGLQITFFRVASGHARDNPSRFAPSQLLFAHAALALPTQPRLLHAQRASRAGLGLAFAAEQDTDIRLGNWSLSRSADDRYRTQIGTDDFALDLSMAARNVPVLQGEQGLSRKGPAPEQASFYYSRPWLAVSGDIVMRNRAGGASPRRLTLAGDAWFDHEWSSQVLDDQASGWDWVGLHLDDGTSLMAFRIRALDGTDRWREAHWTTGPGRDPSAGRAAPAPRFVPQRHWQSPRTGARWPVEMALAVGERRFVLSPMLDDQELDTRQSTGIVYWEGAVRVMESGRMVGRGYLELTGYHQPLRL